MNTPGSVLSVSSSVLEMSSDESENIVQECVGT